MSQSEHWKSARVTVKPRTQDFWGCCKGFPRLTQKGEDKQARKEGRDTDKGEFCLRRPHPHCYITSPWQPREEEREVQRGTACSLAPCNLPTDWQSSPQTGSPPTRLAVLPSVMPVHHPSSSPPQGCPDQSRWVWSPDDQTELGPSVLTRLCGSGLLTLSLALIFFLQSSQSESGSCLLFWASQNSLGFLRLRAPLASWDSLC